ncbi:MAG: ATP-binding protein [Deltaproteobacteria bacterium]|nr:ATP-binding protein [Deltaproteobacteria bacterium]
MDKRKLRELLVEHKEHALKAGDYFARQASSDPDRLFAQKEIHTITGVRRSGKSTLMRLLMKKLLDSGRTELNQLLFLNFEDERFTEFRSSDFQALYEAYLELEAPLAGKKYFFLDEIHNVPVWQRWVNRLYEFEDIKIFVTGSNAAMLSSEVATALTGRNRIMELFPFSFREFVRVKGTIPDDRDFLRPEKRAALVHLFDRYVQTGGFPEALKTGDTSILQEYFRDIIYRDIVARHGLRNVRELKELALYLASNISCRMSYKKLQDLISVRSVNTVKNYLSYLEDAFLFIRINLFDYSIKKQIYNPAKIYCVDHALAAAAGFRFSADIGRTLENIVCLELKRRGHEIYYWRNRAGLEVDFLVKQGLDITGAIQVCHDLEEPGTKRREIKAALAAAKKFGLDKVTVVTSDLWQEETLDGVKIDYLPVWKWLLG